MNLEKGTGDMGDTLVVRHRDLAVKHHGRQAAQPLKGVTEQRGAVVVT